MSQYIFICAVTIHIGSSGPRIWKGLGDIAHHCLYLFVFSSVKLDFTLLLGSLSICPTECPRAV